MSTYTAIIDKGEEVETIAGIEAYDLHQRRGVVDIYQSPTRKRSVDTNQHRVIFTSGSKLIGVFENGILRSRL